MTADDPIVTASGRVLSDADIEALADEAEAGYDIERQPDGSLRARAIRPAVFERDAHAPLPRSGMTLITETGEVLRVERVSADEVIAELRAIGADPDPEWLEAGEPWIIVRVQP